MIINPPSVVSLLRAFMAGHLAQPALLAANFLTCFGRQSWEEWLNSYRLYLQPIPFDIAREAWGITQTQTNTQA